MIQVPPAVGSSGQNIEAVIVTSSQNRHVMVVGDGISTAYAPVTSSGGQLVAISNPSTAVTITNAATTAVTVTNLIRSLSSGTVTLSSVPTVTATAATNPWSSAPGFNMPMVSASSGLVQISGTTLILSASSGLVQTLTSGPITGTVNTLSSGPVLVLSSGPATIAGTVTVLSASSGLVQISGVPAVTVQGSSGGTVFITSSGAMSVTISTAGGSGSTSVNIVGSSNAQAPVTSSGGVGVTILGGVAIGGSTAVNIIGTSSAIGPVTTSGGQLVTAIASSNWTVVLSSIPSLSSGTVTLSSAPLVIVASSGGTIPVTLSTVFSLSSVPTVTATAATNPWSSAPGFNVPIVSASSGLVQLTSQITVTNVSASSGLVQTLTSGTYIIVSASSGFVQAWNPTISAAGFGPVTSSYGRLTGTPALLSSSRFIIASTVTAISPSAGILWSLIALSTAQAAAGAYMRLYDLTTANALTSMGMGGACMLLRISSSVAAMPYEEAYYWPQGIKFGTACAFDIVTTATSTSGVTLAGWVTAQYTT